MTVLSGPQGPQVGRSLCSQWRTKRGVLGLAVASFAQDRHLAHCQRAGTPSSRERRTAVKSDWRPAGWLLLTAAVALLASRSTWAAGFSYAEIARLDTNAPDGQGTMVNDFEI